VGFQLLPRHAERALLREGVARMTGPISRAQREPWRAEVLRQAGVVLQGRAVGLWEVTNQGHLAMVEESTPHSVSTDAAGELEAALRRWPQGLTAGRWWVGCRLDDRGRWCAAPVRTAAPSPPPRGLEWRSHERLALELAALCLGLGDKLAASARTTAAQPGPQQHVAQQLGTHAGEVAAALGVPHAALLRASAVLRESDQLDQTFQRRVFGELGIADRALAEVTALVQKVRERARMVPTQPGNFDLVPVVRTAVAAERPRAAERGVTIEVDIPGYMVPVTGDAAEYEEALGLVVRRAVDSLGGRPGTLRLTLEHVGPVVRLTYRVPALIAASVLDEVREMVETGLGGALHVTSDPAEGTVVTVRLAVRREGYTIRAGGEEARPLRG
jgi:signal transduction histidine kinase